MVDADEEECPSYQFIASDALHRFERALEGVVIRDRQLRELMDEHPDIRFSTNELELLRKSRRRINELLDRIQRSQFDFANVVKLW